MNFEFLEAMSKIQKRSPDLPRAKSLIEASEGTMNEILKMELNRGTSTIIFRETYESIRQLGDARWWIKGYKPKDHDVSMEILKEEKISNASLLNKLDRFREIRNLANYGGYLVSEDKTKEILEFWNECGKEIFEKLKKELTNYE
jgi:uncharacterized protein YutE (UPF0331/DUF86 family)